MDTLIQITKIEAYRKCVILPIIYLFLSVFNLSIFIYMFNSYNTFRFVNI